MWMKIDALTGPVFGRPKSATFRTADVVGIDTLVKVAKGWQIIAPMMKQRNFQYSRMAKQNG